MKKQGKKWMLVALALLALVALPLVGCKNDSVSEIIDEQTSEQTGSETQTGDTEQLAPEDDGNTAPVTYTVTFDSKGGVGEISSQTVESGKTLTKPAEPPEMTTSLLAGTVMKHLQTNMTLTPL